MHLRKRVGALVIAAGIGILASVLSTGYVVAATPNNQCCNPATVQSFPNPGGCTFQQGTGCVAGSCTGQVSSVAVPGSCTALNNKTCTMGTGARQIQTFLLTCPNVQPCTCTGTVTSTTTVPVADCTGDKC
jgi:hypothetical protein